VPATEESLARGELMYDRYCAVCHGVTGVSAEAPIVEKHGLMLAYDLATGPAIDFPDGYIYGMIRVGRGQMPGYGDRVTHFDRWHIVNYVRTLQGAPAEEAGEGG
jgi:mono/diheme cytochrome c family protein